MRLIAGLQFKDDATTGRRFDNLLSLDLINALGNRYRLTGKEGVQFAFIEFEDAGQLILGLVYIVAQ